MIIVIYIFFRWIVDKLDLEVKDTRWTFYVHPSSNESQPIFNNDEQLNIETVGKPAPADLTNNDALDSSFKYLHIK